MLLLLLLVAGVTNTLAQNVTISPTTGKLIAAMTAGTEIGYENGSSAMWRHEQLPLMFTVSDEDELTGAGETANPAGDMRVHNGYLVVHGGPSSDLYCVLSLPKGYRITGYKMVLLNNLYNETVANNIRRGGNKVMYETNSNFSTSNYLARGYYADNKNEYTMGTSSENRDYILERNSLTETDMGNHLYFKLTHTNTEQYFAVTIKSFEVWFTAEGSFDAGVTPAGKDVVRSVVSAPFKTSKIDIGSVERRTKNNQTFFAYSYENVRDLVAYNTIYQENAVVNGVPTQGTETKHIHPVTVNGQNQYAFGNDTYYVETPISVHTSSGLEAPVGYRIVGAKFNYLWGTKTSGGTRTIDDAYYIKLSVRSGWSTTEYYLTDQLQLSTSPQPWSYDSEANVLFTGTGTNVKYLACSGSGAERNVTTSTEKDNYYNLNVFTRDGNTYIGWDNDNADNRYYLRIYRYWGSNYLVVQKGETGGAAEPISVGSHTVTLASYNPGAYTLKVFDKEGNYAEDSEGNPTKGLKAVVNSASDAGGTLELDGLNNDAVKFAIEGLTEDNPDTEANEATQALVSITLQLEALNPYINSMNIVCEDTPKELQLTQPFTASDFKVSGGRFVFYVPEEYGNRDLNFKFADLRSDYGDKTYYNNTASVHNSRYSFVTSEYFTPINGNGNGGLYDTAYNPNATYPNKVVATSAGNIRFKFNNAEELVNTQTNTGRKFLEESQFSVADYLGSEDPDKNPDGSSTGKIGAFNPVVLNASKTAQKSGTFYVFTADETRYNIAPGSTDNVIDPETGEVTEQTVNTPHAWQHRSYAFYRMEIEVQAKTFTPTHSWVPVYDKTCYDNNGDAEDNMWGLVISTTETENGKHGYLTAKQVIDYIEGREAIGTSPAIESKLDTKSETAPASMKQILYIDGTELLSIVGTQTTSVETLKNKLGTNALLFLPVNTTSTLDNVAVKTSSGSFRAGRHIVLTDKKPFYSPYNIQVDAANYASYTRDITSESTGMVKNNTVMLPFTLALEDGVHTNAEGTPGAGTQFTVNTMAANQTLQKEKGQDYGTAYFVKYTEETTEANKPYMIKLESFADETENKIFIASQTGSTVLATTTGTELEGEGSTGKYYVGEENVNASSDKENFVLTNKGSYSGMKFDRADSEKVFYFANDKYLDLRTLTNKKRYLYSYPFRAAYAYTSTTKTTGAKGLRGFFISYDEPQGGTTGIEDATTEADLMVRAGNGYITLTATRAQAVAIHAISGVSMNRIQMNAGETQVVNLPAGIYVVNNVKIVVK